MIQTPGIYIQEKEIITSQNLNLSASTTLFILPCKTGMAMQEVIIYDVDQLESFFGEPSEHNYKEWFQVWNYLQYSSPATVIRVIDVDTATISSNASIKYTYGSSVHTKTFNNNTNFKLYNNDVGLECVSDIELSELETIQIFKRNVGNDEDVAILICSSDDQLNSAISDEQILYDSISGITDYDVTSNKTISKENIWYDVSTEKEYYKETTTNNPKILKHGLNHSYKLINGFYYRIIFDESLQDYETGNCITFKQLINSDVTIDFNNGYFVLAVMKYNRKTSVFNLVESYVLNYNISKKINNINYSQVLSTINESSQNIWMSINRNLTIDEDITILNRTRSLNTNSDTILSNIIRNDHQTKLLNISYEQNTNSLYKSFGYIYDKYSDFNYNSQIKYIAPVARLVLGQLDLNFSSDLANIRKNCISIMTMWNADLVKLLNNNLSKVNSISEFLGVISRNNSAYTNKNSYTACYDNMKYQSDIYTNKNRWIPLAGDVIGIIDTFDKSQNTWDIPAGYNTNRVKNVIKMLYEISDYKLKDKIANEAINLITKDENGQWMLFDMLTNISSDSIFKKLNVRRVVIEIKKIIQRVSKSIFFNANDSELRSNLLSDLNSSIRTITGLDSYKVICDNSNNSTDDINTGRLNIDFYLVPKNYVRIISVKLKLGKNSILDMTEQEI